MFNRPNIPSFFRDDSESDKGEEVVDFFLSWTLRCAEDNSSNNATLHKYAKQILSKLIFDDHTKLDSININKVECWKQWEEIDLCLHVEFDNKKYALIIEDKLYRELTEQQLKKYNNITHSYYKDKDFEVISILFRCADYEIQRDDPDRELCKKYDFKHFLFDDLQPKIREVEVTGNDLFDSFWFYSWVK